MAASIDTAGLSSSNIPVLHDLLMAHHLLFTYLSNQTFVHVSITTVGLNCHH